MIPDLSRAEYDLMHILWKAGRLSVREVHDKIKPTYGWAYSTTKTMMDRMAAKGLLRREKFHGIFLYKPLISRPQGLVKWIEFFADRVLEMDQSAVVSLFARANRLSDEELAELQGLLEMNTKEKEAS